ncbi:MAG TPA: NAD(P)H-binding protein [Chiayiivirga sp.]|nr:NAD(P)H-binding protein [Chiayiivirga sp.]HRQ34331.1 NAD(P)H-binding protein [Chiayiivirga sp.]
MRALVLGATGQIGRFLLPGLLAQGFVVEAVSRQAQPAREGVTWSRFDLYAGGDAATAPDVVFSTGPLDGLLAWLGRTRHRPERIVAFSSTSAETKRDSPDAGERELAANLARAEAALEAFCDARRIGWTILRPTLVYGCGLDANLSRIAALARRWRVVPLSIDAVGLRQPVHAQDLAACAVRAAMRPQSAQRHYDLGGGEALSYREMVQRTVACIRPRGYLVLLPAWLFDGLMQTVSRFHAMSGAGRGVVERMRRDMVFDNAAAARDLDWNPRPYRPGAADFPNA